MADRHASFFGPVLPQDPDAPDAFSWDELQRIRAARVEADLLRAGPSAWSQTRRFQTMLPQAEREDDTLRMHRPAHVTVIKW